MTEKQQRIQVRKDLFDHVQRAVIKVGPGFGPSTRLESRGCRGFSATNIVADGPGPRGDSREFGSDWFGIRKWV